MRKYLCTVSFNHTAGNRRRNCRCITYFYRALQDRFAFSLTHFRCQGCPWHNTTQPTVSMAIWLCITWLCLAFFHTCCLVPQVRTAGLNVALPTELPIRLLIKHWSLSYSLRSINVNRTRKNTYTS